MANHLTAEGFSTAVLHDGIRDGFMGTLSNLLDRHPLRRRDGDGGYEQPHHATVDVLLRLCREAYHHVHQYGPALVAHDVVILDRGLYTKLAYALTVLAEQHPDVPTDVQCDRWRAITTPWLIEPDAAFFLDLPWQQARDRAVARTRSRGIANPKSASRERELFLPHYDARLRWVAARYPERIRCIAANDRDPDAVFDDIAASAADLLNIPAVTRGNP